MTSFLGCERWSARKSKDGEDGTAKDIQYDSDCMLWFHAQCGLTIDNLDY